MGSSPLAQQEAVMMFDSYGYRKSADGRMEPDPEATAVVQLIFQLAAEGINATAITRELFRRNIPTPRPVQSGARQSYPRYFPLSRDLEYIHYSPHFGGRTLHRRVCDRQAGGSRSRRHQKPPEGQKIMAHHSRPSPGHR